MTVLCAGEALVDLMWTPPGIPARDAQGVCMVAGGSPANVATGLARLGVGVHLCSTVGGDDLGRWLRNRVGAQGVHTGSMVLVPGMGTGVVFIHVDKRGERRFSGARDQTADQALAPHHLRPQAWKGVRLAHASSGPLRTPQGRALFSKLKKEAHQRGAWVTLDANLRPHLWPSLSRNVDAVLKAARGVHIIKCNQAEARALTGSNHLPTALKRLRALASGAAIITHGARGAWALAGGAVLHVESPVVRVLDTTGAGDAFMAGVLAVLHTHRSTDEGVLRWALRVGATLGALACTRLGATAGLPKPRNPDAWLRRWAAGEAAGPGRP